MVSILDLRADEQGRKSAAVTCTHAIAPWAGSSNSDCVVLGSFVLLSFNGAVRNRWVWSHGGRTSEARGGSFQVSTGDLVSMVLSSCFRGLKFTPAYLGREAEEEIFTPDLSYCCVFGRLQGASITASHGSFTTLTLLPGSGFIQHLIALIPLDA